MNNYIFPFLWMRGEPEEVIREEIEKIYDCGIRAVCVEARPHDDFCGPLWWRDMDIVIDEAKKRNMKIWILDDKHFPTGYAAGLIESQYPERRKWYLADTTADVFGGAHERTLHVSRMLKPVIGFWQLGQPVNEEERKNNRLIALIAVRFADNERFLEDSVIDLTDAVCDGYASFCLPEGQWRVHAIYQTRTDGGNETYINMLDAVSAHTQIEGVYEAHYQHYPEEFGKTIAGFFSDEPELGNLSLPRDDAKVGTKGIPLPWSEELQEQLKLRWNECGQEPSDTTWRKNLVFLFAETREQDLCPQIRFDYMDCVTRLYEANFSVPIGNWCREHGVEYIGHVVEDNGSHSRTGHGPGHWFRAMTGQDMAGIDIIGSQMIYGAPVQVRKGMGGMEIDGEFFHYILGKLGASAGHLDPKKKGRTMCELFGAYGWSFGVRDMRYLLDQLLVRGVNHLVPHAFSMAEYPDPDCPPHFYARGNNGQFSWFAELMKYANRMCDQLNGGIHKPSVAVLYDGEADWAGEHSPMQQLGRVLMQHQIDFDVVSLDMLEHPEEYNGGFDGTELVINEVHFGALLIPNSQFLPASTVRFIESCHTFPVIFEGGYPQKILKDLFSESSSDVDDSWKNKTVRIAAADIPGYLADNGLKRIETEPAFEMLSVYHYQKAGQMFLLMNESSEEVFEGKVSLPAVGPLFVYDGEQDTYFSLNSFRDSEVSLCLEPGQGLLIVEETQMRSDIQTRGLSEPMPWQSFREQLKNCESSLDLSKGWHVQLCRAKEYPNSMKEWDMDILVPVSDSDSSFSGIVRYTRTFDMANIPAKAFFKAESVFEVMRVYINEEEAGIRMVPPYQVNITGLLKEGENRICVEVANTPGRDQMHYPAPPFDFQHDALEPSGMFGTAELFY